MRDSFIAITVLAAIFILGMPAQAAQKIEPYPLEEWAKRATTSNITLSPNGEKLAMLRIMKVGENPILEIYDANDLSVKPFRMDADPMEMQGLSWITDSKILFYARQKVRNKIDGFNQGVYETAGGILTLDKDPKKSKWAKTRNISGIASLLPTQPNKVLVQSWDGQDVPRIRSQMRAIRSYSYYEYDFKENRKGRLVLRESPKVYQIEFDSNGNPRIGYGRDSVNNEWLTYHRAVGSSEWEVINRLSEDSYESWDVVGFDPIDPKNLLVRAHNGNNTAGIWLFDTQQNKLTEAVYGRKDVDVAGNGYAKAAVRLHSNKWERAEEVTAVRYYKDGKLEYEYFDGQEEAVYKQLESLIPHAFLLSISSRSRDGNTMVISNNGPRDPGTDYLLKNGTVSVIGSKKPGLASDRLADVKNIWYKSRHGEMVNGYITIPNSKPPYPLVVMPHGGPFVAENIGFEEWAQMLANNGYMVLQPQYRGSMGRGLTFYKSAFIDGSEAGYAMQDDKDDGAQYLIDQGLADPKQLAMFGWSYGGYAALLAAARTPQLYQCVIAGASVTDPTMQLNYYKSYLRGSQRESQIKYRNGGIAPIKEVAKVNVPMLMIHGDVDQRVPPEHAEKYAEKLQELGKPHELLWLEGADHFSNSLFYDHKIILYKALTEYLAGDNCFGDDRSLAFNN
jgi:dipeptidyl aminopeptidase/acylaminoacyl peptidase